MPGYLLQCGFLHLFTDCWICYSSNGPKYKLDVVKKEFNLSSQTAFVYRKLVGALKTPKHTGYLKIIPPLRPVALPK